MAAWLGEAGKIGKSALFDVMTRVPLGVVLPAGVRAAQVMAGCTIMLIVAGLLEGYVRQLVGDTFSRFAIGGAMLALWVLYFAFVPAPTERET